MKAETTKPRRVRMNYKVSELHHLFFNQALPEGAKAGDNAFFYAGALFHEKGQPAAAFLTDARGHDDKPAAVILPTIHGGRWSVFELEKAVPADNVHAVILESWPARDYGRYSESGLLYVEGAPNTRRYQSAPRIAACYTAAIVHDCQRAAHSAQDAAGDNPRNAPDYAAACRDLLALNWTDKAAHEYARAELEKVLNYWQLGPRGEYDHATVAAISQREKVATAAAAALPKVKQYFSVRAALMADKTPAGFRRRVETLSRGRMPLAGRISDDIRDILRADLPPALLAGLPVNLAGALNADISAAARAAGYLGGPRLAAQAWSRGGVTMAAAELALIGRGARLELEKAAKYRVNMQRRGRVLEILTEVRENIKDLSERAPAIIAAAASIESGAPDFELICTACELDNSCTRATMYGERIKRAGEISGFKDTAIKWPLDISPVDLEKKSHAVRREACAYADREKWNIKAAAMRAALPAVMEKAAALPRMVISKLENTRAELRGWNWNAAPLVLRNELIAECTAALDSVYPLREAISELAEYENGGAAPASGDWLLIKGRDAITTSGARVPARAIEKAFAFIDSQPAGVFDCRAAGFKIGDYQLNGRDVNGAVIVGCHTFSAASVEHIRGQLAAATAARESEQAA
jgi:hypothetical protein